MTTGSQDEVLRCVWMDAGVVRWKLCDRGFMCSTCPLDLALRSGNASPPPPAREQAFPADRRYFTGHTWASDSRGGVVRTGLDSFIARLFGHTQGCAVLPVGARVRRGQPGAWVLVDQDPVGVPMPVSGRVVSSNPKLTRTPWLATADPYGQGWLLDIVPDEPGPLVGLLDSEGIASVSDAHLELLRAAATQASRPGLDVVGTTAADGGIPVSTSEMRHQLGLETWTRLLRSLLEPQESNPPS